MTKPPAKGYEGRAAETISPIPVLLPGGGLTMFSGATGIGKTAFVAALVKAVLEGKGNFLGAPVFPTAKRVGIIITDRNWQESRYWYDKATVEENPRFAAYCLQDDYGIQWRRFTKPENHVTLLCEYLDKLELPPHSFVVIDPVSPFLGSNLSDYTKTFAAVSPINQVLAKRQLTAVGLHHVMKMKQDKATRYVRPQDRILGSTAIASFTNTQIYIVGPEETEKPYYIVGFIPHNSKGKEFKFDRDSEGRFIPYAFEAAAAVGYIEGTEEEVTELLALFPVVGPITVAALDEKATTHFIAKGKPRTAKTFQRWRKTLEEKKLIYSPHKGYWMRGTAEETKALEEGQRT